jgi:envelope integrity protein B
MRPVAGLLMVAALLAPAVARAEMRPHRAEYTLRLGTALNATRIGTAVQEATLDCTAWHIRRDINVEFSLTPSLKIGIASRMEGEERRDGTGFTWRATQAFNGSESEVRGTAKREDGAWKVEVATQSGTDRSTLPPLTLMPVAAVDYAVKRLAMGSESFPVLMFGGEATGTAFLIDVKRVANGAREPTPPSQQPVEVPGQSWPVALTVSRVGQPEGKPILSLRLRLFDTGILDRVVVDAGPVTVAAHLQSLQMQEPPNCPR